MTESWADWAKQHERGVVGRQPRAAMQVVVLVHGSPGTREASPESGCCREKRYIWHSSCINVSRGKFSGSNTKGSASVVSYCVSGERDDVLKLDRSDGSSLQMTMLHVSARRTISGRMMAEDRKRGVFVGTYHHMKG